MSRLQLAIKNAKSVVVNDVIVMILQLITRYFFISKLGITLLGVNNLFVQIISILAVSELGISTAISYLLYKPLAQKDEKKIGGILQFYMTLYRYVAAIIFIIGIMLLPFLKYIVREYDNIEVIIIFLLFLVKACSSYLFSYKSILLEADQKRSIISNIKLISTFWGNIIQVIVIIVFENYIFYLVLDIIFEWIRCILINIYVNKNYKYLSSKEFIEKKEKSIFLTKMKGLVINRLGNILVGQTDNIIISVGIDVTTVGLVSNYTMIISALSMLCNNFLGAVTASFGNLFVEKNTQESLSVFNTYNLIGMMLASITSVYAFFLSKPFIALYIGEDYLMDLRIVLAMIINYYLVIARTPAYYAKVAYGILEVDWWVTMVEAFVNLAISIWGVHNIGLLGVYLGTLVSGLVNHFFTGYFLFKYGFKHGFSLYVISILKNIMCTFFIFIICGLFISMITLERQLFNMFLRFIICSIVIIIVYVIFYARDSAAKKVLFIIKQKVQRHI